MGAAGDVCNATGNTARYVGDHSAFCFASKSTSSPLDQLDSRLTHALAVGSTAQATTDVAGGALRGVGDTAVHTGQVG